MRKIIVFSMISLDGVMQAPGGPEEDTSEGFKYGGWTAPYSDDSFNPIFMKELADPFDLLLGRKTYDIFRNYWPKEDGIVADKLNAAHKYVVSEKSVDLSWEASTLLTGDVVTKLKALKDTDGATLHVWGSSVLMQTLLKNDLVDELRLRIYPVTIGSGKKLFTTGPIPAAFKLLNTQALPSGVILVNYARSGELKTGLVY